MSHVKDYLMILFLAAIVLASLWFMAHQMIDCNAHGGELVKTINGTYKCVKEAP